MADDVVDGGWWMMRCCCWEGTEVGRPSQEKNPHEIQEAIQRGKKCPIEDLKVGVLLPSPVKIRLTLLEKITRCWILGCSNE